MVTGHQVVLTCRFEQQQEAATVQRDAGPAKPGNHPAGSTAKRASNDPDIDEEEDPDAAVAKAEVKAAAAEPEAVQGPSREEKLAAAREKYLARKRQRTGG